MQDNTTSKPVTRDSGSLSVETESRAQMLLVGALALATFIVAISLVLNSAIYTENLATRSEQNDIARSLDTQGAVAGAGDPAIRDVNWNHHADEATLNESYEVLNRHLHNQTDEWAAGVAEANSRSGQLVGVEANVNNGTRLVQDDDSDFLPYDSSAVGNYARNETMVIDDDNWVVADDIVMRNFTMDVNRSAVDAEISESQAKAYLDDTSGTWTPFTIAFQDRQDSSPDYKLAIYRDDSNNETVKLSVQNDVTSTFSTCTPVTAPRVSVDITNQTFGGNECAALSFVSDLPASYEIYYINPAKAGGNYNFIVNRSLISEAETDFIEEMDNYNSALVNAYADHDHTTNHNPYVESAIFSVRYTVTYRTGSVLYEKTVEVTPEEP